MHLNTSDSIAVDPWKFQNVKEMSIVGSNRNRPKASSSIDQNHRLPLKTSYTLDRDQSGEELSSEIVDSKGALSISNLNILSD